MTTLILLGKEIYIPRGRSLFKARRSSPGQLNLFDNFDLVPVPKPKPGQLKRKNGKVYKLNTNFRWELVPTEAEMPKVQIPKRVLEEELIEKTSFGDVFQIPVHLQEELQSGQHGAVATNLVDSGRRSYLEDDPERPGRYANQINHLRSFFIEEPTIKTQEEFDKAFDAAFRYYNNGDDVVPIFLIRRHLKGEIGRKEFDQFFWTRVAKDDNFIPTGGSLPAVGSTGQLQLLDSVEDSFGAIRTRIKIRSLNSRGFTS